MRENRTYGLMRGRAYPERDAPPYSTSRIGGVTDFSGPVIGWTTRPSNLSGLTFKRAEDNAKMVKKDNGVYVTPGLIIFFR